MTTNWRGFGRRRYRSHGRGIVGTSFVPQTLELEGRVMLSLTPTLTALTSSANTLVGGQKLTLTATVSSQAGVQAVPSGTVTFYNGTVSLGTATLKQLTNASASATLTTSGLSVGSYTFFASYAGDGSKFQGSGSTSQTAGVINTVSGNGNHGDGGLASAADLYTPGGVAVDSAGNVFIADTVHNAIREVMKSSGKIITVAGNGSFGYSGDGGPATSAALSSPSGVALDAAGNIFIADTFHHVIREVVKSSGKIITVAGNGTYGNTGDGGPATSAQLNAPYAVALDSVGNLFIADTNNHEIREVVKSSGKIIKVAGRGDYGYSGDGGPATSARLDYPTGLAIDSAGNLFIADSDNDVIREVIKSTGKISTVAGNGTSGYGGDGGRATSAKLHDPYSVALDSAGDLFIADTLNHVVREVVASTKNIKTFAGKGTPGHTGDGGPATSAELYVPEGVALDAAGNIFIADSYNNVIREVTKSTGKIANFTGTGHKSYSGDGGPAALADLDTPEAVATDSAGNIFIADSNNNAVREIVKSTGKIIAIAGDGTVGYKGDGGPATSAELSYPVGVALDSAGNVFIADSGNNVIREVVKSTGKIITFAGNGTSGYSGDGGSPTSARLTAPKGVVLNAAGDLFIADSGNKVIRVVTKSTGKISTFAGNGSYGYSGDGGPAASAKMSNPTGIAMDAAGDLFIADTDNHVIREVVKSTGKIITVAGDGSRGSGGDNGPATFAELHYPTGVALDAAGDLFIADTDNDQIREVVASTGNIIVVAGSAYSGFGGDGGPAISAQLSHPGGVALDSAGDLFIADSWSGRTRAVSAYGLSVSVGRLVINLNPTSTVNTLTLAVQGANESVTINGTVTLYSLANLTSITINDAGLSDKLTVNVESSSAAIPVTIQLGSGNDTINIAPTSRSLSGVLGKVTVWGGASTDTVIFNDQNSTADATYGVSSSYVLFPNPTDFTWSGSAGSVTFAGLSAVLNGGKGVNTLDRSVWNNGVWNITGPSSGTVDKLSFSSIHSIKGSYYHDEFVLGNGVVFAGSIDGQGGYDTLDESAYTTPTSINLLNAQVTGVGAIANISKIIGGSSTAANTIVGPNTNDYWEIGAANAGELDKATANGLFTLIQFSNFGSLVGGTANDVFFFLPDGTLSGSLNGKGGMDWLDYSSFATPVTVNLATGAATSIQGGVSNVQNVRGAAGAVTNTLTGNSQGNILIGGEGNDTLIGGSGRSILIGGNHTDTITGGSGDDIIIGGETLLDNNNTALITIFIEWRSKTDNAATRIAKIRAGLSYGGGSLAAFSSTTVTTDGTSTLTGGAGNDWFWSGPQGKINDLSSGDMVN